MTEVCVRGIALRCENSLFAQTATHCFIHGPLRRIPVQCAADVPYLSDFGLARVRQSSFSVSGAGARGTPLYMDPSLNEEGGSLRAACDVHSFSFIVWEVLAGRLPFSHMRPQPALVAIMTGRRPSLDDLPADTPAVLRDALPSWWHPDVDARPAMGAVVDVLAAACAALHVPVS